MYTTSLLVLLCNDRAPRVSTCNNMSARPRDDIDLSLLGVSGYNHSCTPVVDMLTHGYSDTPALVNAFRSWLLSCASVRADSSKVTTRTVLRTYGCWLLFCDTTVSVDRPDTKAQCQHYIYIYISSMNTASFVSSGFASPKPAGRRCEILSWEPLDQEMPRRWNTCMHVRSTEDISQH
jgi:hypothetical protein